jgi:hypothetical protein
MIAQVFAFFFEYYTKSFSSSSHFKPIEASHLSGHNPIKSVIQNISFVILVSRVSFLHHSNEVRNLQHWEVAKDPFPTDTKCRPERSEGSPPFPI